MEFIRGQNTFYFSWDFDFKMWFRARYVIGSLEKRAPDRGHYVVFSPTMGTRKLNAGGNWWTGIPSKGGVDIVMRSHTDFNWPT